jgi:ATP-binding cassette subfamily C protein
VLLSDISFEVRAGQAVGIIGPSAGGKTTLVRALTGVWPSLRGHIRLDGAELSQWRPEMLGQQIGYMPQDVSLLDATVEENISRLAVDPDPRKIIEATRAAGVHELIVRLHEGYQTQLGSQGLSLSAGQRQRIGLARALYGNPFLVVLDEPNSNLDSEGDAALQGAIESVRNRGGIAIVIAHRPSVLAAVDLIGVVQAGKLVAFGPKDQILAALNRPAAQTIVQQGGDVSQGMRVPA